MCRTQFFETFECLENLLITNELHLNSEFSLPNITFNPLTFRFQFKYSSKAAIYTLLNISTEPQCFVLRFPMLFQKLHAENFSKLLSF